MVGCELPSRFGSTTTLPDRPCGSWFEHLGAEISHFGEGCGVKGRRIESLCESPTGHSAGIENWSFTWRSPGIELENIVGCALLPGLVARPVLFEEVV